MSEPLSLRPNADRTCVTCGYSESGYLDNGEFFSEPNMLDQALLCPYLKEHPTALGDDCPSFNATLPVAWPTR